MYRTLFLLLACWCSAAWTLSVRAEKLEPLHIHMLSGAKEYRSEESLKILQRELKANHNVSITASWVSDGARDLPGLEHIPEADLLLVFARRMKLPEKQVAVIRRHWESGKPIVGIRTASHAFSREDNQVFDHEVLGGNYQGHFGSQPVNVSAVPEAVSAKAAGHPVLKDVGAFVSSRLYKAGPLPDDTLVLQTGTIESKDATEPVTWVHTHNGGRTFYTSLGVPEDFRNEDFRRMLINAIFWATKQSDGR